MTTLHSTHARSAQAPTAADVAAAARRIAPYARRTPILRASVDSRPVVLKLEHLQRTGSFKLRGALSALLAETEADGSRPHRVVTASGGNHGLAVATAAALLDLPATVFVPDTVPEAKARRIEAAGARLIRQGSRYADAAKAALEAAQQPGTVNLPAYDHPNVIAGQGTVAAEVVDELPEVDTIAVAVGGGGLAAGTTLGSGERQIVAAEPENCRSLNEALAAGTPVDCEVRSVASSALGATRVGEHPFAVLSAGHAAGRVRSELVDDDRIVAARDRLWEEFRLAVEPAAAVPFAAWLDDRVPGELPCLVLCGANSDWLPG